MDKPDSLRIRRGTDDYEPLECEIEIHASYAGNTPIKNTVWINVGAGGGAFQDDEVDDLITYLMYYRAWSKENRKWNDNELDDNG